MHSTGWYSCPVQTWPQASVSPALGTSSALAYFPFSGKFGMAGSAGGWRSAGAAIGSGVGLLMTNLAGSVGSFGPFGLFGLSFFACLFLGVPPSAVLSLASLSSSSSLLSAEG